ncbi:MAG: hypothetical protein AB7H97_13715, partial [Pseudobdellovibrionaceae bacterium]
ALPRRISYFFQIWLWTALVNPDLRRKSGLSSDPQDLVRYKKLMEDEVETARNLPNEGDQFRTIQ